VPVGEILDAVDALVVAGHGEARAREHIVIRHPLQPFDPRNFTIDELGTPGPFSFDRHAAEGAVRALQPRRAAEPFLTSPLPPPNTDGGLALDDLIAFLEQPVKAFLRQRLGLSLLRDEEVPADSLDVQLDNLRQWSIGDRLLKARLAGADAETCIQAEWRRQSLPPGELGRRLVNELMSKVEPLVLASSDLRATPGRAIDVTVEIDGRRITGTVGRIHGDSIVRVEYSSLGPKHRLRAWAQLLALTAAEPSVQWQAVTLGRGPRDVRVSQSILGPLDRDTARMHLQDLLFLYDKGMREPLPLAVKTSHTYASLRRRGMPAQGAQTKAALQWVTDRFPGEQDDPAHVLIWGERPSLELLTSVGPRPDELGDDRWRESRRFGLLARQLWEPLLDAERLDSA
jgi:exodeoxyribonuclease V gamma subunit